MKICFLCDLHLPYHTGAIQYDVLRWALADIQKKAAEALVVPGDFTVHGDIAPAEHFMTSIAALGIPTVVCTGNSEYRNPETKEYFRRLAAPSVNDIGQGWKVIAIHDGECSPTEEDYAALEAADDHTIAALHHPFHCLPAPHRDRLNAWRERHPEVPVFFGHLHHTMNDGNTHMLTASDPDKVAGEHPCITYYDTETRKLEKAHYYCPVPNGFYKHIGLSCYLPETDIPNAIKYRLSCIELRPGAVQLDPAVLDTLVQCWREHGGNCLSLHAPNLADEQGITADPADWKAFLDMANRLRADRVTIHVPQVSLSVLHEQPELLEKIADFAAEQITALPETCVIGMENMHMRKGETAEKRCFGYIPEECLMFTHMLQKKCRHTVGIHLDVGHARNNMPLVETYTLAPWYAEVGSETVGYHIHQVRQIPGGLTNHLPIDNFFGPMICFAAFFRQWSQNKLNHAPVILEIRPTEDDPAPYLCTLELLRKEEARNVFDIHAHTRYSFCGRDEPQALVDVMIENGIRLFGICDHNYGIGTRKREYLWEMRALAEANRDRIRILAGIEIATLPQKYDIEDPSEIADYDYCLLESITDDESIVGSDLFGFCEKLGIRCGIAHTDIFDYCRKYSYNPEAFLTEMERSGIFWEMNVSYDSIHRYWEHPYVKAFTEDPEKLDLIRRTGVYVSVGFDGHRMEDYDGYRVHNMYDFLKANHIRTADLLFAE